MVREALERAGIAQEVAKDTIKNATEQIKNARLVPFHGKDEFLGILQLSAIQCTIFLQY